MSTNKKIVILAVPITLILLGAIMMLFEEKEPKLNNYIVTFDSTGESEIKTRDSIK